jgi:hypothetical protein
MKASKFEKHIHKLCKQFTVKTPKQRTKKSKTKSISKAKNVNNVGCSRINISLNENVIL